SASAPVFAGPLANPCAACCSLICIPEAKPARPVSSCSRALQPAS
ncbi:rCG51548, partial [Rattus norvegicus]